MNMTRRQWLIGTTAMTGAALLPAGCSRSPLPPLEEYSSADAPLRFPGKVPMRVINDRPPCLETPWRYFRDDFTPNEAFYVRWHLQMIPTTVDLRTWRLRVGGHVERPLELSLDELRRLDPTSIVAVNQCSGNSRSLAGPRVPGAQWAHGAMGNARWTGVRLSDLLQRAGLKSGAVQVTFNGLDEAPLPSVPDFVKALDVENCTQPEVLVAYEMNGAPLPMLNGFPLRLVVPGWYATYWVKALSEVMVLTHPFDGYWMAKAYRIPTTPSATEEPLHLAEETVPINRMNVRSFIVDPEPGASFRVGQPCLLEGIAFDAGNGIRQVEVSFDGGRTWRDADLAADLGRFSFRRWRYTWQPGERGEQIARVRATSNSGETQPTTAGWNRSAFMRNVIEELRLNVV